MNPLPLLGPAVARIAGALALPRMVEVRAVAADASLLLLVGGLAMLCVIMVLVAIQNVVPEKPLPVGGGGASGLPESQQRLWPRRPKKVVSGLAVDKAMARIVHLKLGEPRILQARTGKTRVRLYACPGCAFELEEGPAVNAACTRERAGIEQAFREVYGGRVAAWEISCRRRGDDSCDFEVKH